MTGKQTLVLFSIMAAACAPAQAAPLRGSQQLLTAQGAETMPPEALPAVHSPHPYREVARKPCNEAECTLKFSKIENSRLLEISNLSCITFQAEDDTGKFFVLSKSADVSKLKPLVAILPATNVAGNIVTTNMPGPYYFDAGETVYVSASSPANGVAMICTLSGTLWRTD